MPILNSELDVKRFELSFRIRSLPLAVLLVAVLKSQNSNYEITPRLASLVLHLGLDLAVHQARPERSSALHLCGDQVCNRVRNPLCDHQGAPPAASEQPRRLDAPGRDGRFIFQS